MLVMLICCVRGLMVRLVSEFVLFVVLFVVVFGFIFLLDVWFYVGWVDFVLWFFFFLCLCICLFLRVGWVWGLLVWWGLLGLLLLRLLSGRLWVWLMFSCGICFVCWGRFCVCMCL